MVIAILVIAVLVIAVFVVASLVAIPVPAVLVIAILVVAVVIITKAIIAVVVESTQCVVAPCQDIKQAGVVTPMPMPIHMVTTTIPTIGMVVIGILPGLIVIPHPNEVKTIMGVVMVMRMVVVARMVDLQHKSRQLSEHVLLI